jgi:eukaryotic-like serine/threonine-protein kinase
MLHDTPERELFLKAHAERKAPLTIFAGSGLSASAGIPTWKNLENSMRAEVEKAIKSSAILAEMRKSPYKALQKSSDPWITFELIESVLGKPTFEGLIEKYLSVSENEEIPLGYFRLLELYPQGFVTLNLDRFAGDAVSQGHIRFSSPIYGLDLAQKWNALLEQKPHLVYLHGDILNPSTWILTKSNLDILLKSEAHKLFLMEKFTSNLVLFTGISAEDISLSSRIINLRDAGIRPRNLFWLTNRLDSSSQKFADDNFIKIIRYDASNDAGHLEAIEQLVSQCANFRPTEPKSEIISNEKILPSADVSPSELVSRSPNEIRFYIASKINQIVRENTGPGLYSAYRDFCAEYHFAIHQAFYRNKKSSFEEWFDYKLQFPPIGRGNFGEVYGATGKDGELVAVKIMNEGAFNSDDMLGGFRRGARSMRMVGEAELKGMIPLLDAYELPPTIVMPFVSGVSLQEAVERRKDMSWETKVRIGAQVASTVTQAHTHPATILHRDLKPSNIMISNFEYSGEFDPDVIVLDFDMSWHKGSDEKDVVFESRDDFGFLAPEQTIEMSGVHARTTKVDSYGLGMTLYYLFGHVAPLANEPLNPSWSDTVLRAVSRGYNYDWKSAPTRLARTIVQATYFQQMERLDFFRLRSQLELIAQSITSPNEVLNIEAWGEELLARIGSAVAYKWDDSIGGGSIESLVGAKVSVETDATEQTLLVKFEFRASGYQDRSGLPHSLRQNLDGAMRELKNSGWRSVTGNILMGGLILSAQVRVSDLVLDSSKFDVAARVYKLLQR